MARTAFWLLFAAVLAGPAAPALADDQPALLLVGGAARTLGWATALRVEMAADTPSLILREGAPYPAMDEHGARYAVFVERAARADSSARLRCVDRDQPGDVLVELTDPDDARAIAIIVAAWLRSSPREPAPSIPAARPATARASTRATPPRDPEPETRAPERTGPGLVLHAAIAGWFRASAEGALHIDVAGRWHLGDGFLGAGAGIEAVHQPGASPGRYTPVGAACAEGGTQFGAAFQVEVGLRVCGRFGEVASQGRTGVATGADAGGWVALGGALGASTLSVRLGFAGGALVLASGEGVPLWYVTPSLGLALGFR